MDRLLCGDVGFGKTEVALRAAFKAIQDGKQVAVLVPTTILAQQHLTTCRKRFAGLPVQVEMLSRFRSPADQKAVRKALREGKLDLIIGTHRLVQKDLSFKELGLLIIDEEQRFGVEHKEKLKKLRENVDCLTLTATPIPRTLHMSLAGMRDMSVIETPPEGRLPVQTYVVELNDELVRDAILREMNRGGQAYYIHNRVQTIEKAHRHLREILPEARIAVAHGQMPEDALERTMLDFLDGEYDVLLATTIVESGLDMPRVNTLVVEDADRLGLAQLYQLRGRIGRASRLAYAYFTYRRDKVLTEVAQKRLEAVREFTELGSGFRIAMRDLELRGAGNILGPEQHGFISSVGFELYRQLLEEAVNEVRGLPHQTPVTATVDLPVEAYIPDGYIPDSAQKIEVYHRIVSLRTLEEADELVEELRDRFGGLPDAVENLLGVARVRIRGEALGLSAVLVEGDQVVLRLATLEYLPGEKLRGMGGAFRGRASFHPGKVSFFALRVGNSRGGEMLATVEEFLRFLGEARSA